MSAASLSPGRVVFAEDAVARLRPGMTVFVGGVTAEPLAIRAALGREPERARGVRFLLGHLPGINEFDYAGLDESASSVGVFVTAAQRPSFEAGRHHLLHASWHGFSTYLLGQEIDFAFVATSPPDEAGRLAFGLNADFADAVRRRARVIVAEVSDAIPRTPETERLEDERIVQVRSDMVPAMLRPDAVATPDQVEAARYAAGLIRDGDCLQVGIGKLPDLILAQLRGHRRLGLHTGLASDGCLDLIEAGALTGEAKTADRGLAIATGVIGTERLYRATGDGAVSLRPSSCTHGQAAIQAIDRFTAVNSALEVDLFGQVNATHAGARIVSGIGGFRDFVAGAAASQGGRAIVVLPSRSRGRSRIVPALAPGVHATATALDIDHIVTEHGVAAVRNTTLDERAARLVAIAAPEHREALARAWHEMRRRL